MTNLDAKPAHFAGGKEFSGQAVSMHGAEQSGVTAEFIRLDALGFEPKRVAARFGAVKGEGDVDGAGQRFSGSITQGAAEFHQAWNHGGARACPLRARFHRPPERSA